ncbi:hypothetical protein MMS45_23275, partial [Escherichia coli]|nr:hypothetical protein [Escherichia coli]
MTIVVIKSRIRKSIKRFDENMTFIIFPGYFPYLTVLPVSAGQQSALSLSASEHHCLNRPGFPGECFICELRLPDHRFRWKHNKLFLLLPEEYGPAFP